MLAVLLQLALLFDRPVTNAYAQQVKDAVVVSVTYEQEIPVVVCVSSYALDDGPMTVPLDSHCWKPTQVIGDMDVWERTRLDMLNFKVTVRYPKDRIVDIALVWKIDT
jgi:hypothetical protein